MARNFTFRRLRQVFLLYVLLMVALATWLSRERSTDWNNTLWVAVYPINGDQSEASKRYIESLNEAAFAPVQTFFTQQIGEFGHTLEKPVHIMLKEQVLELPPALPAERSFLNVISWSMRMRYWSYRIAKKYKTVSPDINLYMIYFDPVTNSTLGHSVGLQKGLFGIVNGYADRRFRGRNQVIFTHELMHTLGATDKYDPATTLPIYPTGYANPDAKPLLPQTTAELMGGRIPISETEAAIPGSLRSVVVGPATAREIRWLRD